ncbi:MAG: SDR family oxidoreductase [Candidatus Pacebacteria bacterium]|nr:SDR family oxidoreductase [Candidatus Paceibacterota bacterium]
MNKDNEGNPMDLNDKVVIVTGAGSGVGRALALEFAEQGARVVCAARRIERIEETAEAIEAKGGTALAVPTDVTDMGQVNRMVSRSLESFGRIDVLFNNAGSFGALGPVWEVDPGLWWNDVTVNLRGTMLCCRAALAHMLERDSGILINMSGGNQIAGGTGYSASKVAVIRFTELLARELEHEGSSVLAFIMGPGFVRTEMTELQIETAEGRKWLPSSKQAVEQGRNRPPEDCARASAKLIRVACPELNGMTFGPDTDFDDVLAGRRS